MPASPWRRRPPVFTGTWIADRWKTQPKPRLTAYLLVGNLGKSLADYLLVGKQRGSRLLVRRCRVPFRRSAHGLGVERQPAEARPDLPPRAGEHDRQGGAHAARWVDGRWQPGYCRGNHRC